MRYEQQYDIIRALSNVNIDQGNRYVVIEEGYMSKT